VTLPSTLKANLKLRSDRGEIFTDFDVQTRAASISSPSPRGADGRIHIDVNQSIQGTVNGGGPELRAAILQRQHLPAQRHEVASQGRD
jgi:hypothetical protein